MNSVEPTHTSMCVRRPAAHEQPFALESDHTAERRGQHQPGNEFYIA